MALSLRVLETDIINNIIDNMSRSVKGAFHFMPKKPFDLLPKKTGGPYEIALNTLLKNYDLKQVQRIDFVFDPFKDSKSIRFVNLFVINLLLQSNWTELMIVLNRNLMFSLSAERVRQSNPKCSIKTTVLSNRTEPEMRVKLESGSVVKYKTSCLTELEVLNHLNQLRL